MSIVYLSTFLPREKKEYYASKMHDFNFNSADTFSYSVFCGLVDNLEAGFQTINIPPLGAFPRYNSLIYSKSFVYYDNNVLVKTVSNSNLYVYQYYSIYTNVLRELRKLEPFPPKTLLIYSINIPVLKAAIRYKKVNCPDSKIVLIIPDLLEDCMERSFNSKIKMALIGNIEDIYNEMDGFVFLTEQMNERVKTSRPYCVVEGIYNEEIHRHVEYERKPSKKVIFYSGMLYEKFGVRNLIDAFCKTTNPDFCLQLCGCGELEEYIKRKQEDDKRIEYLGLVSRDKVLHLQSKASLLVNPRTPQGDFTKYSFPSKDIEYLASGTPALIYQLPGIPHEYYEYCYSIDSNHLSEDYLAGSINRILSLSEDERSIMSSRARKFILENKNAVIQTKKIINLISGIQ